MILLLQLTKVKLNEVNLKKNKNQDSYKESGVEELGFLQGVFCIGTVAFFVFAIAFHLATADSYLRIADDTSSIVLSCLAISFIFAILLLLMLPVKTVVKAAHLYVKEHEENKKV